MPIIAGPGGGEHLVGGQKRIQAANLVEADDIHAEADALRVAVDVFQPGEFVRIVRQPQAAAGVPADVLSGQGFQARVQLIAVGMNFREVVAARDAGALAGGVPGGPRGELVLLDQNRVRAALEGEVVEQACAHHPAADDDDACVCFHENRSCVAKVLGHNKLIPRGQATEYSATLQFGEPAASRRYGARCDRARMQCHGDER